MAVVFLEVIDGVIQTITELFAFIIETMPIPRRLFCVPAVAEIGPTAFEFVDWNRAAAKQVTDDDITI